MVIIAALLMGCMVYGAYSAWEASLQIPSGGIVVYGTGAAYYDLGKATPITFLDWTTMDPGTNKNLTVYVYNNSTQPADLNITAQDWQPTNCPGYMAFTTDYNGTALKAYELRMVNVTLTVHMNCTGITDFSFDIVIEPEEP